jgi:hypothetical protein
LCLVGCTTEGVREDGPADGARRDAATGDAAVPRAADLAAPSEPLDLAVPPDPADLTPTLPSEDLFGVDITQRVPSLRLPSHGGAVMPALKIWTVVQQGDAALGARIDDFTRWLAGSAFFTQTLSGYGVGAAQAMGVIVLPFTWASDLAGNGYDALADSLAADSSHPGDASTLYAFIENNCAAANDVDHHWRSASGTVYATLHYCNNFDETTRYLTHELAEAATDPDVATGYFVVDQNRELEVGDLCNDDAVVSRGDAGVAHVSTLYAQGAACVPAPVPNFGVATTVSPVVVSGAGVTVTLRAFADGDVGIIHWSLFGADPGYGVLLAGETVDVFIANANLGVRKIMTTSSAGYSAWWFNVQR